MKGVSTHGECVRELTDVSRPVMRTKAFHVLGVQGKAPPPIRIGDRLREMSRKLPQIVGTGSQWWHLDDRRESGKYLCAQRTRRRLSRVAVTRGDQTVHSFGGECAAL
jgi:hypothetical protein